LTPASQHRSLTEQIAAFHTDWNATNFKTPAIQITGGVGASNSLQLLARRDGASNDLNSFIAVFDLTLGRITAAAPSWKYWPMRWAAAHGPLSIGDPEWVYYPATMYRGPYSPGADDWAGNGPYYSRITSGPITATEGQNCPARPTDSPIPIEEWPTGEGCLTVTVDGEPGDPSPASYATGTITTRDGTVQGAGTNWSPFHDGSQMLIGNTYYQFRYVSPTSGTLSPTPPPVNNASYRLFLEPVNHPRVGNPAFAYLQDAEVRDVFCGVNDPNAYAGGAQNGCGVYWQSEWFRLIVKNGNSWTLQRGYAGASNPPQTRHPLNARAYLIAAAGSCDFVGPYPCYGSAVFWNTKTTPYGNVASGLVVDRTNRGGGHNTIQSNFRVDSLSGLCQPVDGQEYGCYNIRLGQMPAMFTVNNNFTVSNNPAFAGKTGIGEQLSVDSHPSYVQWVAPTSEQKWFLDARPFLGAEVIKGEGTRVGKNLYRFNATQFQRFRPRLMPTLAMCGVNPLLDVSGPTSLLTDEPADSYKYCVANAARECARDASPGDVYVNCPMISTPACTYPGVGASDTDIRDICIADNGAYTQTIPQIGYTQAGIAGATGRVLTQGLSRYRWYDIFWNAKSTPDGKWILFRTPWLSGQRHEVLMAKAPPFPEPDNLNRSTFISLAIPVNPPVFPPRVRPNIQNVVVEFGYDPDFNCTSRREACVKGDGADFKYTSEPIEGVACASGCTVQIPAISQRVVYYRVKYRDPENQVVVTTSTAAVAVL
jgi:hypothetical protein